MKKIRPDTRKVRLDPDALTVDSFEASPGFVAKRGTVRGNDSSFVTVTTFTEPPAQCPNDHSGQPCVEFEATPLTLCDENCFPATANCG